jgi:DNA-binding Lrp family transcriptional regulator
VLITVDVGTEKKVAEELEKVPGVKEVYEVYGTHDIVARVETENLEKLRESVFLNIRKIKQIKSTSTLIIVRGKKVEKET